MVQSKPFHLSSIECGDHRHCSFVTLLENQQEMLEFEVDVM